MSTESVVRHALQAHPPVPALEHSQPTLNRPVTQESTLTSSAPVVIGGITLFGLLGLGAMALVGLGVGTLIYSQRGAVEPEPMPLEVVEHDDGQEGTDEAQPPAALPTLTLTSEPAGAVVREGAVVLGPTPLTVQLDPKRPDARLFELTLEGYEPWEHEQPVSEEDVAVSATLVPVPKKQPRPVKPQPAPTNPDLDIINER